MSNTDKNVIPKILIKTGPLITPNNTLINFFDDDMRRFNIDNLKYFNDYECFNFIKNYLPELVLKAYSSLIPPAYKADLFRYCALYILGGVYMDLTNKFVNDYNIFDDDYDMIIANDMYHSSGSGIQISFIACKPKLEFMRFVIENICIQILTKNKGTNPLDLTGPHAFRRQFVKFFGHAPKDGCHNYSQDGNNYKIKMDLRQTSKKSIEKIDDKEEIISVKSLGEKEHRDLLLDPEIPIPCRKTLGTMHKQKTYRKNDYAEHWRQNKIFC